jgi:hypothetical protein
MENYLVEENDINIENIQAKFEEKLEETIKALSDLWKSSTALKDLYTKSNMLYSKIEEINPVDYSPLTINDLSLIQAAHFYLRRMEEKYPEVCKRVDHEEYRKRFEVVFPTI